MSLTLFEKWTPLALFHTAIGISAYQGRCPFLILSLIRFGILNYSLSPSRDLNPKGYTCSFRSMQGYPFQYYLFPFLCWLDAISFDVFGIVPVHNPPISWKDSRHPATIRVGLTDPRSKDCPFVVLRLPPKGEHQLKALITHSNS